MLGATLFLLYINDAEHNLPHNVYLAVYAGDTTLYATIRLEKSPEARNRAQSAPPHMHEWGMTWRVAFEPKSPSKCLSRDCATLCDYLPFRFWTRLFWPRTAWSSLASPSTVSWALASIFIAPPFALTTGSTSFRRAASVLDGRGCATVYICPASYGIQPSCLARRCANTPG